jgi:Protein of unknown function (DUF1592)/Protein of unknown function (DUF1588)/Protein of unknown function (DUF1585)/Protein of unknown function (DUF1595)
MKATTFKTRHSFSALLAAAFVAAGCTGEINGTSGNGAGSSSLGGPGGPGGPSGGGAPTMPDGTTTPPVTVDGTQVQFAPAAGSFKRLTMSELKNSLIALLGPVTLGDVEPDTFVNGFAKVGGSTVSVSLSGVAKYQTAIEAATAAVFADKTRTATLVGCTPKGTTDTTCFSSFIQRFGRLAWRRALTPAELARETTLASGLAQTLGNATDGLRATTNALLLSPNFLYRLERGEPDSSTSFWHYTGYEVASRLSYFLTNNAPDEGLLTAAEQGKLAAADGIRAEADRLLNNAAGHESVRNFATELFRLAVVAGRAKDPTLFPSYTASLQQAMMREVPSMLEDLVFSQAAPATDLFTTHTTFVNADLAKLYGLSTSGLTADSWVKVTLPSDGLRTGFLGTGAFLSEFANQKEGSPTTRGKFMRTVLLCQTIPDPPANVSTVLADAAAGMPMTKRDKLAKHREQGSTCAGCHSLMDPLGLPLENFDAIGAYRATDQGLTIDVSGDLDGKTFNGPVELGQILSQSDPAKTCLVRNLSRYATGVAEAPAQEPTIAQLATEFQAEGGDLRKLMLDLVQSDGFRLVSPATP